MMKSVVRTVIPVIALLLSCSAAAQSTDAQPCQRQPGAMHTPKAMMQMGQPGAAMDCGQMHTMMQQMREQREQMHAQRQQMAAEMDELVQRVNTTTGAAQQEAMAELLTRMVAQRQAMQDQMSEMQPMMMQSMMRRSMMMEHMMGHMEAGEMVGKTMSGCPMMQEMMQQGAEGEDAAPDDHTAH